MRVTWRGHRVLGLWPCSLRFGFFERVLKSHGYVGFHVLWKSNRSELECSPTSESSEDSKGMTRDFNFLSQCPHICSSLEQYFFIAVSHLSFQKIWSQLLELYGQKLYWETLKIDCDFWMSGQGQKNLWFGGWQLSNRVSLPCHCLTIILWGFELWWEMLKKQ